MLQWLAEASQLQKPWPNITQVLLCGQPIQPHVPRRVGSAPKWPAALARGAGCLAPLHSPSDVSQSDATKGPKVTFVSSFAFGLNRVPNFARDVHAVKTFQFLDACRGGHVDLCQVFSDHVDPNKHLTLFFQKRANACADF